MINNNNGFIKIKINKKSIRKKDLQIIIRKIEGNRKIVSLKEILIQNNK